MPILEHQIEALVSVGVKKVVLAVSYRPDDIATFIASMEKKYGISVVCSLEVEPMGTGECLQGGRAHWPFLFSPCQHRQSAAAPEPDLADPP